MKSKAQIKSHPIHPILICFPVAFFAGTFIFDILGLLGMDVGKTPQHLIVGGLIGGVAAAVPGIIDYIYTVPPKSSGKKRAAKHGMTNVVVLLLFAFALLYRTRIDAPQPGVILAIETIGITLLGFAGWMGGTLVYRNQIGVDPRYANAGKWKEEYAEAANGRVVIDKDDQLSLNQMKLIHAGEKRIVLARTEKGLVAFSDHCTHRGGSLAGGSLMCGTVQCPWHGSQFDVNSGAVKAGPSKERISIYPIKEEGGKLVIELNA